MIVITPIKVLPPRERTTDPAGMAATRSAGWSLARAPLLVLADAASLGLAFAAALVAAGSAYPGDWAHGEGAAVLALIAASAASVMLGLAARGDYGPQPFRDGTLRGVATVALMALLATGFLAYLLRLDTGRIPLFVMWAVFGLVVPLARGLARLGLDRAGAWRRKVLIVGSGDTAQHAKRLVRETADRDYEVAAVLDPAGLEPMRNGSWSALLRRHQADLVVLAMDPPPRQMVEWLVRDQIPYATVPRSDGSPVRGTVGVRLYTHDAGLWSFRNNLRRPATRAAKLVFDVVGAAALLVALSPLMLLIAGIIKIDGGRVLYAHRRVGAGGRSFPCLKFRSMVLDSDAVLARVLATDPAAAAEWAATRKLRDDPRVTAIGDFLRRTSLDELPQLFNVLRLEMSLVGPRPIVDAEVPRYGDDIHFYYAARPGLTGLWQISGRSDTGYSQRVRFDAWYVTNWSFRHDFMILAKTVPAVLKRRGAV